MKMRVSLFSIERMHRLPLCREECLSSISTGHAPSLWGGECFRSVHRKYIPLWWGECHIECISSIGCILFIYEWRRKYPSYRSRVRNPYPWRGECLSSPWRHSPTSLCGGILSSCIDPWSLTSKLVVVGDPSCVSHEFVQPMFLRHPVGFDGYLAGISLSSCTLFSVANIGVDMLRIPLCLIEHVGILHISMFASSTQFVWFWCMFRQCKMCRRSDVHHLWIVAIFAKIESVQNRNLLV